MCTRGNMSLVGRGKCTHGVCLSAVNDGDDGSDHEGGCQWGTGGLCGLAVEDLQAPPPRDLSKQAPCRFTEADHIRDRRIYDSNTLLPQSFSHDYSFPLLFLPQRFMAAVMHASNFTFLKSHRTQERKNCSSWSENPGPTEQAQVISIWGDNFSHAYACRCSFSWFGEAVQSGCLSIIVTILLLTHSARHGTDGSPPLLKCWFKTNSY